MLLEGRAGGQPADRAGAGAAAAAHHAAARPNGPPGEGRSRAAIVDFPLFFSPKSRSIAVSRRGRPDDSRAPRAETEVRMMRRIACLSVLLLAAPSFGERLPRCTFGAGALPSQTAPHHPHGSRIPIDTIVVLMQENRSF